MALTERSFENRWDPRTSLGELEALAYRSNLLAADRAIVNFGGGNTSVKTREADHTGRMVNVLWVKGSGSDLATIGPSGFTGLRLDEILPLAERDAMTDQEMVSYLARCQLDPSMPRPSIETLLHAFVPHPHVDHTHPDAIGAIVGSADGERLARECFGADAVWIPYLRPGFALSKLVAQAVAEHPEATVVLLAKHGLVTWGATAEECVRGNARRDQSRRRVRRRARARRPGIRRRSGRTAGRDRPRVPARRDPAGPARCRVGLRPADPPGGRVGGGGRVRLRIGLAHALPGGRRMPRSPRAHAAPAGLGRVRPAPPRTPRRCRTGLQRACANGRRASSSTSRGIGRTSC